jgi:putative tryptophan/tyrosine transport system substrate-binding protein
MRRREFITLLGGAAATWPLEVWAQQPPMPVIGFLGNVSPELWVDRLDAFRQGLSETNYVEGKNVAIEYRWANGYNDRLPALVAELIRREVTVITALGSAPAAIAAHAATTTIPIVFETSADPVQIGLVASLNRPGGNVTGIVSLGGAVGSKRLELLHELVPTATTVGILTNPTNPAYEPLSRDLQAAARTLGLQSHVLQASTESDFDTVFASLAQLRVDALVILADSFFTSRRKLLGALTVRYAVPAVFQYRDFATAGGLMSYGTSFTEPFHQAGVYTGRVLKGEKPADLPIQQATKVELVINLKTAKALGISVPLPLAGRADEVIE